MKKILPAWASTLTCAALTLAALPVHALEGSSATSNFAIVGELGSASGVLIADNWVLTAAHVVSSATPGSISFTSLLGTAQVDGIYRFSNEQFPANDLALVHLSTSISGEHALLNDTVIHASQVNTVGPLTAASARNQQPNGYASTTAIAATVTDDVDNGNNTVNWLITQGGTVQGGDSGSALFQGQVTDSNGALLLGIASALLSFDDGSPSLSGYVQVAAYKGWIDTTLSSYSNQQATWASAVPEPSLPAMAMAGGLIAVAMLRRGQRPTR